MAEEEKGGRQKIDPRGNVVTEKVRNVWGSVAGAGSDFFHLYRKHRTTEMERIKAMEDEHEETEDAKLFEERKQARADAEEAKTQKRSEKRKRRKLNKDRNEQLREKGAAINAFSNDGSFLGTLVPKDVGHHEHDDGTAGSDASEIRETASSRRPNSPLQQANDHGDRSSADNESSELSAAVSHQSPARGIAGNASPPSDQTAEVEGQPTTAATGSSSTAAVRSDSSENMRGDIARGVEIEGNSPGKQKWGVDTTIVRDLGDLG